MSLGVNALVTLDEAKAFLKKTDDADLSVLELLIDGVSEQFNAATDRTLKTTTYTDLYLDGNGQPDIYLPNYPVTTLTSVYEDGTLLTEGLTGDFVLYSSNNGAWLHKLSGTWLEGPKTIKITYTAGYGAVSPAGSPALPQRVKTACLIQLGDFWQKFSHKSWGETARSLANQSVTIVDKDILPIVKTMLAPDTRYGL